ncbi:MAG: hypothetical protein ABIY62_08930 [Ginsengibacter sp.]
MYNHIWKKYLPIIRILLKKSITVGDQVLNLNRVDFERAGTGRKAGYKFTIEFTDGKVGNVISGSTLAMHLASVILEDDSAKQILMESNYEVSLNTKFQLSIKNTSTNSTDEAASKKREKDSAAEEAE